MRAALLAAPLLTVAAAPVPRIAPVASHVGINRMPGFLPGIAPRSTDDGCYPG